MDSWFGTLVEAGRRQSFDDDNDIEKLNLEFTKSIYTWQSKCEQPEYWNF